MLLSVYKRAILKTGFGDGPIPINTLYVESKALLADPIHPPAGASKLATTGVNRDTLYVAGWLDLSKGPLVLHVPDFPTAITACNLPTRRRTLILPTSVRVRLVQKRAIALITGPGWKGVVPRGMTQISSPINSVDMVFGRVLVYSDSDLATVLTTLRNRCS